MILIDTSAWIDFFRGKGKLTTQVAQAVRTNQAALCGPVVTEIRRGLRPQEAKQVLPLFEALRSLEEPDDLWSTAGDLGRELMNRGVSCKTFDLLIATYGIAHDIPLLTNDKDFEKMNQAGIPLRLIQ